MATPTIESLLESVDVQISARGREITCHCPFHKDSHPSFSINAKTGLWICYQCGRKGTLLDLLEELGGEGTNVKEMLQEVRYKQAARKGAAEEEPEPDPFSGYMLEAKYYSFRDRPPLWALHDRRLYMRSAQAYGIRWDHGWIIPIWSPEGEFLGWQFKRLKYVSNYPPGVKKSRTLFGLDQLKSDTVVLVESPLDVVRLHRFDISAVASFGAMVSKVQLGLLQERAERIVLALDNDEEGWAQTDKIYPKLARSLPTIKAVYPAKDPGDLTDRQIQRAFGK